MQCPLPTVIYEVEDYWFRLILIATTMLAVLFLLYSTFILDHWSFMGITQAHGNEPPNLPFGRVGPYGWIRHPQYLGQFLAFWCRAKMTEGDLVFAIAMSLYILIAVRYLEEPALIELIGDDYVTYTHEVPAYFPIKLPGCFLSQKRRKAVKANKKE